MYVLDDEWVSEEDDLSPQPTSKKRSRRAEDQGVDTEYSALRLVPLEAKDGTTTVRSASAASGILRTLQVSTANDASARLEVTCGAQDMRLLSPHCARAQQEWSVEDPASTILQYLRHSDSDDPSTPLVPREWRAGLVAFSPDGHLLRVGAQLYSREHDGDYRRIGVSLLPEGTKCLEYVEEFSGHGAVIAVASRRPLIPTENPAASEKAANSEDDGSDSESDGLDDEDEPSVPQDDEAYESCSQCSSADDVESDSDSSASSDDSEDSDEDSAASDNEDADEDAQESAEESDLEVSGDDGVSEDDESEDESLDVEDRGTRRRRQTRRHRALRIDFPLSLDVFSSSKHIFHFSRNVANMLHDSPPAVHPNIPLVVWPLTGSEVLFADYEKKTYFTRTVGKVDATNFMGKPAPQMPDSDELISVHPTDAIHMVKCHFSPCGRYLHLALVRSQVTDDFVGKLYVLCTRIIVEALTYRLCTKRPTRSAPTLLHRVAAPLATLDGYAFEAPSCTFTWAPRELYVTSTAADTLKVHKIALFAPDALDTDLPALPPPATSDAPGGPQKDFLFFPGSDNVGVTFVLGDPTVLAAEYDEFKVADV
ncbi:hypothetical protein PsYK624_009620 [Phanerochaete sordida]|uniref:Uncharacterized protein n=1 Tax=Phanerochaete sordida TaxID=48140 RepID=A0A9P3FYH3_9APHY|nr:hypothetical protein PsYK624_009620 [Phanerochaete sordida]